MTHPSFEERFSCNTSRKNLYLNSTNAQVIIFRYHSPRSTSRMTSTPKRETIVPYFAISLVVISRVAKAIALGGVLIGRLIASDAAKATPSVPSCVIGLPPVCGAITVSDVTIGISRLEAEV